MTRREFRQLTEEKILILDGATGSNLLKRGMPHGVCTEQWVCEHPKVMEQLQREYVESGSHIIYAPTFSGNRIKLAEYGLLEQMEELNHRLVEISKKAAQGKAYVAGDITMTGAQLEPLGELTFDELTDIYKEQISIIAAAGADLLVIETMMSLQETRAAVAAAKQVCDLPVMATLSFKESGRTLYGVSAEAAVVVLQGMGVDAVGLNCSFGPDKMLKVVKRMKRLAKIPLIVKPNAGMPRLEADGTTGYDMSPQEFGEHMKEILEHGANLIGGCCGSTPEFIKVIAALAKDRKPQPPKQEEAILLCSEREVFSFAPGQKLNIPAAIDLGRNKELAEEYREEIYDTAVDLAFELEEEWDIIPIAAKAEGISEKKALLAVAEEISRNVNVPCMISTDSPETAEYVVAHFPGIIAIELNHNLKEWETQIKSIAKSYQVPIVTIDNEIIYC